MMVLALEKEVPSDSSQTMARDDVGRVKGYRKALRRRPLRTQVMPTQAVENGRWISKNTRRPGVQRHLLFGRTDYPLILDFWAADPGTKWLSWSHRWAGLGAGGGRRPVIVSCLLSSPDQWEKVLFGKQGCSGLRDTAVFLPQAPATCCSSVGVGLWVGVLLFRSFP